MVKSLSILGLAACFGMALVSGSQMGALWAQTVVMDEETGGTSSQEPALSEEDTGGLVGGPVDVGSAAPAVSPLPAARPVPGGAAAAPQPLPVDALPADPLALPSTQTDPGKGPVTNLPLPRYVTLKTGEGNARRGPGLSNRIDWVFTRAGMPLRVTAEYENWRRVEDTEGLGGWVHYSLLSGVRSVLIQAEMAEFRAAPDSEAEVVVRAERNVIGRILECNPDWCRLSVEGEKGWVSKAALWGVEPGEVIE